MNSNTVIDTPFGSLELRFAAGRLCGVEPWLEAAGSPVANLDAADGEGAREAQRQIAAYLRDPRFRFTLELEEGGTPFQRRVWAALREIPAGTTLTYGELARRLGSVPRAVGQACRRNPIPVVTPCHRVVAAGGIGGYSGETDGPALELKRQLLRHEGAL